MKILLDVPKEGLCGLSKNFYEEISSLILSEIEILFSFPKKIGIGLSSASLEDMAMLNKENIGKEGPTDILSFPAYPDKETIKSLQGEEFFLGDIILCEDIIRKDAEKDDVSYEREMAFVFSHGILHLFGYEHSEEMFALQDKVCENIKEEKITK
ncbi:MAG: rRNA maturation RNase YbeY [Candidatus Moraniibacteriota bacterium]|nr:MAG: rRNA maturation RNase YbeY [Candidatus Moranbacteria bacterium]